MPAGPCAQQRLLSLLRCPLRLKQKVTGRSREHSIAAGCPFAIRICLALCCVALFGLRPPSKKPIVRLRNHAPFFCCLTESPAGCAPSGRTVYRRFGFRPVTSRSQSLNSGVRTADDQYAERNGNAWKRTSFTLLQQAARGRWIPTCCAEPAFHRTSSGIDRETLSTR